MAYFSKSYCHICLLLQNPEENGAHINPASQFRASTKVSITDLYGINCDYFCLLVTYCTGFGFTVLHKHIGLK
jgi:hypothetical protein